MTGTTPSIVRRPLRAYLLWLVLATLLPGVVGASLLFVHQYQKARAQFEKNTLQTVRALVHSVDNKLMQGQAIAQTLSTIDALAAEDFSQVHRQASEALALAGGGMNLVLRDRSGQQIVNTGAAYGSRLPLDRSPQLDRVFATGKASVSDVFIGPLRKRPTARIDVPVTVRGERRYVLSIGMRPEYFADILTPKSVPEGAVASLFDRKGVIFSRNINPAQSVGKPVNPLLRNAAAASNEGTIDSRSREGRPLVTSFSRSALTGWGVAIGIPRETLRTELLGQLAMLAAGVAVLFAIGLCLAWIIGGRMARSLQALTGPALALGKGGRRDALPPFAEMHVREAADIAAAIGDAAALLDERSRELAEKESALREAHQLARFGTWHWKLGADSIATSDSVPYIFGRPVPPFDQQRGSMLTEASWQEVQQLTGELARSGGSGKLQLQAVHAEGHHIWLDYRCESVHGPDGRVTALRGTMQDITERVRAEEALRQADQRKNEFLAMLGHELRNPLAPITSGAQLLGQGGLDPARTRQISAIIGRQARHMAGLVDDLLDVSRVTRGLVVLAKERIDINAVVLEAAEQVQSLVRDKRHRLDLQLLPQPCFVSGDRKRLVQVVGNLLHNAAKFTEDGGQIDLLVALDGDNVRLEVRDNGIGMLPAELERAFDMFVQGERTPDRTLGGLGIGLALVRSLVQLHGGSVGVASAGQGMGTSLTVRLPRCMEHRPDDSAPVDVAGRGNHLKVLVVDDNVDAARVLAMVVGAHGHEVLVEHGSPEALARAPGFAPDVCLLDIGLPEMDGYELARRLRRNPATAHATLVAVTGYGQDQDRRDSKAAGFDHHLVKPVDMESLERILAGVVAA
ncbi:hybrid sensor histidine kinase/response regulator [Massilia yuzhufengensis]|uniref:histidine kinase n=1 Tax=Massilia yuzhufengensis TaxID=1164594 RepID=A0A1I1TKM3_9BURK|nr:ATP-binding protein [Massilia yuzhufengensis]SFD59095.1 PAS domain S-box-containing protein [Massilia yuzhufengensis]